MKPNRTTSTAILLIFITILSPSYQINRTIHINREDVATYYSYDMFPSTKGSKTPVDLTSNSPSAHVSTYKETAFRAIQPKAQGDTITGCSEVRAVGDDYQRVFARCGNTVRSFSRTNNSLVEVKDRLDIPFDAHSWDMNLEIQGLDFYIVGTKAGTSAPYSTIMLGSYFGSHLHSKVNVREDDVSGDTPFQNKPAAAKFLSGALFGTVLYDRMLQPGRPSSKFIYAIPEDLTVSHVLKFELTQEVIGIAYDGISSVQIMQAGSGLQSAISVYQGELLRAFICAFTYNSESSIVFSYCHEVTTSPPLKGTSRLFFSGLNILSQVLVYDSEASALKICYIRPTEITECIISPRSVPKIPGTYVGEIQSVPKGNSLGYQIEVHSLQTQKSVLSIFDIRFDKGEVLTFDYLADRGVSTFISRPSSKSVMLLKDSATMLFEENLNFPFVDISGVDVGPSRSVEVTVNYNNPKNPQHYTFLVIVRDSVFEYPEVKPLAEVVTYLNQTTQLALSRKSFIGNNLKFQFNDLIQKHAHIYNFNQVHRNFTFSPIGAYLEFDMLSSRFGLALLQVGQAKYVVGVKCFKKYGTTGPLHQRNILDSCYYTSQKYLVKGQYRFKRISKETLQSAGAVFFDEQLTGGNLVITSVFFGEDGQVVVQGDISIQSSVLPNQVWFVTNGKPVEDKEGGGNSGWVLVVLPAQGGSPGSIPIFSAPDTKFSQITKKPIYTFKGPDFGIEPELFCPQQITSCSHDDRFIEINSDCGFGDARILKSFTNSFESLDIFYPTASNNPILGGDFGSQQFCPSGDEFHIFDRNSGQVYSQRTKYTFGIHHWNLEQYGIVKAHKFLCVKETSSFVILGETRGGEGIGAVAFGNMFEDTRYNIHSVFHFDIAVIDSVRAYAADLEGHVNLITYLQKDSKGILGPVFLRADLNGPQIFIEGDEQVAKTNIVLIVDNEQEGSGQVIEVPISKVFSTPSLNVTITPKTTPLASKQSYNLEDLAQINGPVFDVLLEMKNTSYSLDAHLTPGVEFSQNFTSATPFVTITSTAISRSGESMHLLSYGQGKTYHSTIRLVEGQIQRFDFDAATRCNAIGINTQQALEVYSYSCRLGADYKILYRVISLPSMIPVSSGAFAVGRSDHTSASVLSRGEKSILITRQSGFYNYASLHKVYYANNTEESFGQVSPCKRALFVRESSSSIVTYHSGYDHLLRGTVFDLNGVDFTFQFRVGGNLMIKDWTCVADRIREDLKLEYFNCLILFHGNVFESTRVKVNYASKSANIVRVNKFSTYPKFEIQEFDYLNEYIVLKGTNFEEPGDMNTSIMQVFLDHQDHPHLYWAQKIPDTASVTLHGLIANDTRVVTVDMLGRNQTSNLVENLGQAPNQNLLNFYNINKLAIEFKEDPNIDQLNDASLLFTDVNGQVVSEVTLSQVFDGLEDRNPVALLLISILAILGISLFIYFQKSRATAPREGGDAEGEYKSMAQTETQQTAGDVVDEEEKELDEEEGLN